MAKPTRTDQDEDFDVPSSDAKKVSTAPKPPPKAAPKLTPTPEAKEKPKVVPWADHIPPKITAQAMGPTWARQEENVRAMRLADLARSHPEVAWLLEEYNKLKAAQ